MRTALQGQTDNGCHCICISDSIIGDGHLLRIPVAAPLSAHTVYVFANGCSLGIGYGSATSGLLHWLLDSMPCNSELLGDRQQKP